MMRFLGTCNCGKLALLTRYRVDGSEDLCISCVADREYKRLTEGTNGPDIQVGVCGGSGEAL